MIGDNVMFGGEAAKYMRMSPATLKRHVDAGRIPVWTDEDTGRKRYPKAALDEFLRSFADRRAS